MRRYAEVAHNVGHHAMSGMNSLIPHLFASCRETNQYQVVLNLLSEDLLLPSFMQSNKALILSAKALKAKFIDIIEKAKLQENDLKQAVLFFTFEEKWPDNALVKRYLQVHPKAEYAQNPAYRMQCLVLSTESKKYVQHFQSWHFNAT